MTQGNGDAARSKERAKEFEPSVYRRFSLMPILSVFLLVSTKESNYRFSVLNFSKFPFPLVDV